MITQEAALKLISKVVEIKSLSDSVFQVYLTEIKNDHISGPYRLVKIRDERLNGDLNTKGAFSLENSELIRILN
jgi:hypothetical protein